MTADASTQLNSYSSLSCTQVIGFTHPGVIGYKLCTINDFEDIQTGLVLFGSVDTAVTSLNP